MSDLPIGFATGWISDPARVQDSILERAQRGDAVTGATFVSRHKNELPGTWARMKAAGHRGVFLRDQELKQNGGKYRRPYYQKYGTCVARGVARAVQVSLDAAINLGTLLKPAEISFAPIYSLARHEVGKDRCGSGDGAILADAMRAIHDYGVATNQLFPGTSEDDQERIAVKYAAPGIGTPSSWISACQDHTCVTFWPETLGLLMDCIAAGYAVPYANNKITGRPNKFGISQPGSWGPHCRAFVGVFIDENGVDQLESAESWSAFPAAAPDQKYSTCPVEEIPRIKLRYAGGEKDLAPGDVGVNAQDFWNEIRSGGEAWATGAPSFIPTGVAELTRKVV